MELELSKQDDYDDYLAKFEKYFLQEEPSEEAGAGAAVCRWRSCGRWEHWHYFRTFTSQRMFLIMSVFFREMGNREALVEHVKTCHEEYRKGCEEFPCLWEVPGKQWPMTALFLYLHYLRYITTLAAGLQ